MKEAEIAEFKDVLTQFEADIKSEIKEDPEYAGEADQLCQAMNRLQAQFININTSKDYEKAYEAIAADLDCVMRAAMMFSDVNGDEESDFDLEEIDFEDDEDLEDEDDLDLDDMEFVEDEEEEEEN